MAKKSKSTKAQSKSANSPKAQKASEHTKSEKTPSDAPKNPAGATSAERVEQLNASIERKKKASKKPKNNPAHSDQNVVMDVLPTKPSYLKNSSNIEDIVEEAANSPEEPETSKSEEVPDDIIVEALDTSETTKENAENATTENSLENFASAEPEPINIETENPKLTQDIALNDLENSTELENKPVNKKANLKKWRILPKIIAIITVGLLGYLGYLIFVANVLPTLHLCLILGVFALFAFLTLFKSFRGKTRTPILIFFLVLNIIISGVSAFAIFKINDTLNFFSKTLGASDKEVSVYNIIVKKDSSKNSTADLAGKVIHSQRDLTMSSDVLTNAVREQLNASVAFSDDLDYLIALVTDGTAKSCSPSSSTSTSLSSSTTSTSDSAVSRAASQSAADAEAYSEATKCYYSALEDDNDPVILVHSGTYDGITSDNTTFSEKTKIIGEVKVEVKVEHKELDNITTKPFMIYISGIDTRTGTLPARSLSDVNMVAVVNPVSRKLLLVSIPRDYYVHIAGTAKGALRDKLTHAGSTGGVQLSMTTISELLDLDLNQYIRVNFNFVENLVNAIGGINIYNDQNYSFNCWTNRRCVFQPGYNYVHGDCALAFARERHAYEKGDRHRGENQQQVIKLVLDKVTSSSTIISKYSDILDALVGTFETTLTQENITDLVKMHVSDMTPWTVETYNLNGTTGMDATYSYPSQSLSVMYPDETTIETAKQKIAEAMGQPLETKSETEAKAE